MIAVSTWYELQLLVRSKKNDQSLRIYIPKLFKNQIPCFHVDQKRCPTITYATIEKTKNAGISICFIWNLEMVIVSNQHLPKLPPWPIYLSIFRQKFRI